MSSSKQQIRNAKFYGYASPLSNLRFSMFVVGGVEYNSMEQFLALKKSQLAGDQEAETKIKEASNPCLIRAIEIKGLDEEKWHKEAPALLHEGLQAKFHQNPGPRKYLLKTGERKLLYCDKEDPFLGTGLNIEEVHRKYPGQNLLGKALMEARAELMKEPVYLAEIASPPPQKRPFSKASELMAELDKENYMPGEPAPKCKCGAENCL